MLLKPLVCKYITLEMNLLKHYTCMQPFRPTFVATSDPAGLFLYASHKQGGFTKGPLQ